MTRSTAIAGTVVILLAAVLRLGHLNARSLENDEIAEATWSSKSFGDMMKEVRRDAVHPPADYIVQFVFGRLGGERLRRIPSIVSGIATVACVMLLADWWVSPVAAIAAGLLLATSPMHLLYSQQVRPYSTAFFYVTASLVALELFARTRRRAWAVVWFILVFLAGATLYLGGMIAAATGIVRIFLGRRDALAALWRRLPMIVLLWTVLYAPWLPVINSAAKIPSPARRQSLDWLWWRWRVQSLGTGIDRIQNEPVSVGSWVFWLLVLIGSAASVRNRALRVAAFWMFAGTALEIAVLQVHPHYPAVRYLMPSWLGGFVLAGAAIDLMAIHSSWRPVAVAAVLVYLMYAAIGIDEHVWRNRSEWREIAEYVHARVKPGDRVYATSSWVERNMGYYWSRMAPVPDVPFYRFFPGGGEIVGPVWIVSGGCPPREALYKVPLMRAYPASEGAQVRYLRPEQRVPNVELCSD